MFWKAVLLILATAVIGAALLGLRQQRLNHGRDMVLLQRQIDHHREELWDLQVRISGQLKPPMLLKSMAKSGVKFDSITPQPSAPGKGPQLLANSYAQE